MKITKLYFQSVRVFWDCLQCGQFNVEEVSTSNCRDGLVTLQCQNCLGKKKGRINVKAIIEENPCYPFTTLHKKKMNKKKKEYAKKWDREVARKKREYIKELKKGKRK